MTAVQRPKDLQTTLSLIEARLNTLERMNNLRSASIGEGGLRIRNGGGIQVEDGGSLIATYPNGQAAVYFGSLVPEDTYESGLLIADIEGDSRTWFAQLDSGIFVSRLGGESILIESDGNVYTHADGGLDLQGDSYVSIYTPTVARINTPLLGLYSLPTTSSGANLFLGYVGADWTVAYITSSRKYKQDIEDLVVDPEAVLRWRPRTWRDKAEVEKIGDAAATHVGFIAEEIADETPEFAIMDDEGEPDALKYDRMVAGLLAVVQQQQEQIKDLKTRVETLENQRLPLTLNEETSDD